MAELFEKMATNELSHARIWFNLIQGNGQHQENLLNAAQGENYEWKSMYPPPILQSRPAPTVCRSWLRFWRWLPTSKKIMSVPFMEEYVKAYADAPASPFREAAAEKLEEEELEGPGTGRNRWSCQSSDTSLHVLWLPCGSAFGCLPAMPSHWCI